MTKYDSISIGDEVKKISYTFDRINNLGLMIVTFAAAHRTAMTRSVKQCLAALYISLWTFDIAVPIPQQTYQNFKKLSVRFESLLCWSLQTYEKTNLFKGYHYFNASLRLSIAQRLDKDLNSLFIWTSHHTTKFLIHVTHTADRGSGRKIEKENIRVT